MFVYLTVRSPSDGSLASCAFIELLNNNETVVGVCPKGFVPWAILSSGIVPLCTGDSGENPVNVDFVVLPARGSVEYTSFPPEGIPTSLFNSAGSWPDSVAALQAYQANVDPWRRYMEPANDRLYSSGAGSKIAREASETNISGYIKTTATSRDFVDTRFVSLSTELAKVWQCLQSLENEVQTLKKYPAVNCPHPSDPNVQSRLKFDVSSLQREQCSLSESLVSLALKQNAVLVGDGGDCCAMGAIPDEHDGDGPSTCTSSAPAHEMTPEYQPGFNTLPSAPRLTGARHASTLSSQTKSNYPDQLLMFIDNQIAVMMERTRGQLKTEILNEVKVKIQIDDLKADIVDELSTKLRSSVAKEEERDELAPVCCPETMSQKPTPRINERKSETFHYESKYQFANSIWDLAWFIGMDEIGHGGSVMVIMMYVLNLILQISFCILCHRNFIQNELSEEAIDGLHDFRLAYAHDYRLYDQMSGKSLIQHICADNGAYSQNMMVYGARQLEVINVVRDFLDSGAGGFLSLFNGVCMCLLSLVCWVLCLLREARQIVCCVDALLQIPRGPHTVIASGEMKCVGRWRFAFIVGLELQETAICIAIGIYGCTWLSQTSDIQELLLNAAALDFVLSVDEMVFDALTSRPMQVFIENLAPLVRDKKASCKGIEGAFIVRSLVLLAPVLFFYGMSVKPMIRNMKKAESALCGNDRSFVYGVDQLGLIWIQRLDNHTAHNRVQDEARQSVHNVMNHQTDPLAIHMPYLIDPGVRSIYTFVAADSRFYPDALNRGCIDLPHMTIDRAMRAQASQFLNYIRVYTNNFSISSCNDVLNMGLCAIVQHPVISICSQSCGCGDPRSAVFSIEPAYGCPASCVQKVSFTAKVEEFAVRTGCTDIPVQKLQELVPWQNWTRQLIEASNIASSRVLSQQMAQFGCAFLNRSLFRNFARDFCEGKARLLRPLSPYCPQACNCSFMDIQFCPSTCKKPLVGQLR